jgi:hypothetical protein
MKPTDMPAKKPTPLDHAIREVANTLMAELGYDAERAHDLAREAVLRQEAFGHRSSYNTHS